MPTCRDCRAWREPFEPRGPALERFDRGCAPVRSGAARADWPQHPDEDRSTCPAYFPRHGQVDAEPGALTNAELNRRAANPRWREADAYQQEHGRQSRDERAGVERRAGQDRRSGVDRRGNEARHDRDRRRVPDRRNQGGN